MKCFLENEDYYTYGEYIQRYGGPGQLLVITGIKPGETYAISFGSPTTDCGFWCQTFALGAGGAATAGVVVAAVALGIVTGGVGAVVMLGVVAVGTGVATTHIVGENIEVSVAETFYGRDINSIYLTTLDQIQNQEEKLCRVVRDIDEE